LNIVSVSYFVFAATLIAQVSRPRVEEQGQDLPVQVIGINDLVTVAVYSAPELSHRARVGSDGNIRLPLLKQKIKASGLFPEELETAIAQVIIDEEIMTDPFVTVTIAEYQSRPINVVGGVRNPLTFQAAQTVTLLEAIARAGGISPDAGNDILVNSKQIDSEGEAVTVTRRIPIRALIDDADPALNIQLRGGEEIRVPMADRIFVVGNVKRPGVFTVQNGDTTVLQMVALAGGLERFANDNAFIYRKDASGIKAEIAIPLSKIMERKSIDAALEPNDILYIPDNKGKRLTTTAFERIAALGGGASTALIYSINR
jgi:polysaccharide export outer membrane protein